MGHIVQWILNIVYLKPEITLLLSWFLQNNIRASLDKLALRNRGVGQKKTTPESETTPNMPEAKRGDKTEARLPTKSSESEPPATKKIKLQETNLHNPSESRIQPEGQASGSKSTQRKSEYFDPKDNWTETTETNIVEKLEVIDFKL